MDNKQAEKMLQYLQQLVAIQLYRGGAKQQEIADNLGVSIGKINSMVKGLKAQKDNGKK